MRVRISASLSDCPANITPSLVLESCFVDWGGRGSPSHLLLEFCCLISATVTAVPLIIVAANSPCMTCGGGDFRLCILRGEKTIYCVGKQLEFFYVQISVKCFCPLPYKMHTFLEWTPGFWLVLWGHLVYCESGSVKNEANLLLLKYYFSQCYISVYTIAYLSCLLFWVFLSTCCWMKKRMVCRDLCSA